MEVGSGPTAVGLKESVGFIYWVFVAINHKPHMPSSYSRYGTLSVQQHVPPDHSKVLLCDAVHIAIPAWEGVAAGLCFIIRNPVHVEN